MDFLYTNTLWTADYNVQQNRHSHYQFQMSQTLRCLNPQWISLSINPRREASKILQNAYQVNLKEQPAAKQICETVLSTNNKNAKHQQQATEPTINTMLQLLNPISRSNLHLDGSASWAALWKLVHNAQDINTIALIQGLHIAIGMLSEHDVTLIL